jgi:hypothetical protein
VFPDVKSENKLLIYCPFMKKSYGGHMGKYGGHMGKYGGHMGKNGEPIYDLGHMGWWTGTPLIIGKELKRKTLRVKGCVTEASLCQQMFR